ncbi:hypothetical protein ACFXPA_44365 [Amycolatopsis sp. NPDC059090]|uniref:hypothetical protein n=1 Tax=unclassified Amycolatopsis TaxID=2618356 RepID=UPI00366CC459
MRIRLMGTEAEIAAVAARIATVVEVQEVSDFYPNRGTSTLGRVYLTVAVPTDPGPLRATAERADDTPRLRNRRELES